MSLAPTQPTPRITLPPKHLLPSESETEPLTTEPPTTTVTMATERVYTWPWWYTTQPWSSTTAAPTTKEWDEGKQADDAVSKVFASPANPTNTTMTSSFRDNSIRFEKTKNFRPLQAAVGATSVVEGENAKVLQKTGPAKSRPWSYRVPTGPRRSPQRERPWYTKPRTTTTNENFLAVVDREADQIVNRNGSPRRTNKWVSWKKLWV